MRTQWLLESGVPALLQLVNDLNGWLIPGQIYIYLYTYTWSMECLELNGCIFTPSRCWKTWNRYGPVINQTRVCPACLDVHETAGVNVRVSSPLKVIKHMIGRIHKRRCRKVRSDDDWTLRENCSPVHFVIRCPPRSLVPTIIVLTLLNGGSQ